MLSRMYLLAGALCVSSYALAVTPSIGSVTARGEIRIDNQQVQGSGTVFDGSVVETGQSVNSGADLRLANKVEITLSRDSRGTLYSDHFILQRGTAQFGSTNSFRVQAKDVVVVPAEANSSGIVSIDPANSVTVSAKQGTFEIRNTSGASVAQVRPGLPLKFSSLTDKSNANASTILRPSNQSSTLVGGVSVTNTATPATTRVCPPDPLVPCCPGIPSPKCCNPFTGNQCSHSH